MEQMLLIPLHVRDRNFGCPGGVTLLSSAVVVLPLYPDISHARFDPPACNSLSGGELK